MHNARAYVMAAGRGTRLAPLTDIVPKPAMPVGNEPVMGHALRLLARHGIRDVVSNIHYLADTMEAVFGDGTAYGVNLTWSREPELLGTAGGMKNAEHLLRDGDAPVLVMSGDGIHAADLSALIAGHVESGALATIGVHPVDDPSHYGVVVSDDEGWISSFQEKPSREEALSLQCNTGVYVFSAEVFDLLPDGFFDFGENLFPLLVQRSPAVLRAVEMPGYWNDIGTLEAYRDGNLALVDGRLDLPWMSDSVEDGKLVAPTARVDPAARFFGPVVVGPKAVVEAEAQLASCVVLPGARVTRDTLLPGAVFGSAEGLLDWAGSFSGTL